MPRVEINGQVVEFARMPSPEDIDHVAASLAARSTTTTPTTQPTLFARAARAAPATAGMIRGAETGAQLGRPLGRLGQGLGAIGGAALGSGLGEGALALGQRLLRAPRGQEPILPRVGGAAVSGGVGEAGGRTLNLVPGLLGRLGPGSEAGQRAISRMGESALGRWLLRGPARRETATRLDAVRTQLEQFGGALDKGDFAERLQSTGRRYLARVERILKGGRQEVSTGRFATPEAIAAQKESYAPILQSLKDTVGKSMSTARIVAKLADDPAELARVARQLGPNSMQELQRAWLTTNLIDGQTAAAREGAWNTTRMVDRFEELGARGQDLLFGDRADSMRALFATLRGAKASEALTAAKPTGMRMFERILRHAWGTLGGTAYTYGRHASTEAMLLGAGVDAARFAVPLVYGRVLLMQGGPEWMSAVIEASQRPELVRTALPRLLPVGVQLVTRALTMPEPGEAPAAGTTTTTAAPTTTSTTSTSLPPIIPGQRVEDTGMELTLPSNWRPGMRFGARQPARELPRQVPSVM